MNTETIDRLFLELSQFASSIPKSEIALRKAVGEMSATIAAQQVTIQTKQKELDSLSQLVMTTGKERDTARAYWKEQLDQAIRELQFARNRETDVSQQLSRAESEIEKLNSRIGGFKGYCAKLNNEIRQWKLKSPKKSSRSSTGSGSKSRKR